MIAGSLDNLAGYAGPFAALSAEGMANERRETGLNSSVMCWDAGEIGDSCAVQAVYGLLREAYKVVSVPWIGWVNAEVLCEGHTLFFTRRS